ncbi:MAG: hypothetical protein KDE34_15875 [Anaerolineales bacterium]|nr:hypothetical protein [Anaerolineales bacterium]
MPSATGYQPKKDAKNQQGPDGLTLAFFLQLSSGHFSARQQTKKQQEANGPGVRNGTLKHKPEDNDDPERRNWTHYFPNSHCLHFPISDSSNEPTLLDRITILIENRSPDRTPDSLIVHVARTDTLPGIGESLVWQQNNRYPNYEL